MIERCSFEIVFNRKTQRIPIPRNLELKSNTWIFNSLSSD